jgi:hypothetical protein
MKNKNLYIEILIKKVTKVWSCIRITKVMLQKPKKKTKFCWREVIISVMKVIKYENWRKTIWTIWIFLNKGVLYYIDAVNRVLFFPRGFQGGKPPLIPDYNWTASQTSRSSGNNWFPYVFHYPSDSYKFQNQYTNDSYKSQIFYSIYMIRFTNAITNILLLVIPFKFDQNHNFNLFVVRVVGVGLKYNNLDVLCYPIISVA